jgi:hypothetical protein
MIKEKIEIRLRDSGIISSWIDELNSQIKEIKKLKINLSKVQTGIDNAIEQLKKHGINITDIESD